MCVDPQEDRHETHHMTSSLLIFGSKTKKKYQVPWYTAEQHQYDDAGTLLLVVRRTIICQRGAGIAGGKKEKKRKRTHESGDTTGTHNSNEAIHQPTYSSTAERSTAVTPTKRFTHPCITAARQKTYQV